MRVPSRATILAGILCRNFGTAGINGGHSEVASNENGLMR
jgi:hypothetical protein